MKKLIAFVLVSAGAFAGFSFAQNGAPAPIFPDTLRWVSPPGLPKVQGAWVLGGDQKPGVYIFRVRLHPDAVIAPHTHPDERNTTVLKGTIYVGFGENFNQSEVVAVPEGAVYIAPANVPHFIWAREGEAVYQEAGVGPTGTSFIKR
jgi:quercetin dioxygenase-like cupin family protein